ncbi:MAG TPA: hypothetical protein VF510_06990 [Ktedonobacterales bacterium]
MSTHSTVARRRRMIAARNRADKKQVLRLVVTADIERALRLANRLYALTPSGDTRRRYLAASFTLVASLLASVGRLACRATVSFRARAADLLSKARSFTGERRDWAERRFVYAGPTGQTGLAPDGTGDAAGAHRETASHMPLLVSWRLVLVECMTRIVRPDSPFEWDEYDWRHTFWGRQLRIWPGVLAGFGLLVVVLALAFILASRATNSAQARLNPQQGTAGTTVPSGIIVEQPGGVGSPTPGPAQYQIGAWTSDSTPSGPVKVFVRVSSQTKPVPNVPVTISVSGGGAAYTLGPTKTDADGLATFTVSAGGGGQPVFVTATAVVGRQTLTHETTFFPQ